MNEREMNAKKSPRSCTNLSGCFLLSFPTRHLYPIISSLATILLCSSSLSYPVSGVEDASEGAAKKERVLLAEYGQGLPWKG